MTPQEHSAGHRDHPAGGQDAAEQHPSRTLEIVADSIADTVTPAVAAVVAAAAIALHNPELGYLSVPIGAVSGAFGKQGAVLIINTMRDRTSRVERLLEKITTRTGKEWDDFQTEHIDTDPKRRLLTSIVAEATDATTAWRIQTLADAFLHGAADETRIDETLYFVARTKTLDPGHARVLAVVADAHDRGVARTSLADVSAADPGIGLATALLTADLVRLELLAVVRPEPDLAVAVTTAGLAVAQWLAEFAHPATPPPFAG